MVAPIGPQRFITFIQIPLHQRSLKASHKTYSHPKGNITYKSIPSIHLAWVQTNLEYSCNFNESLIYH